MAHRAPTDPLTGCPMLTHSVIVGIIPYVPGQFKRLHLVIPAIAFAAILYRFPPSQYAFYPACPIHQFTGLLCPGCGATRAVAALLHGHLAQAIHFNALVVLLLPLAVIYLAFAAARPRFPPVPAPLVYALLALALVFGIARNVFAWTSRYPPTAVILAQPEFSAVVPGPAQPQQVKPLKPGCKLTASWLKAHDPAFSLTSRSP